MRLQKPQRIAPDVTKIDWRADGPARALREMHVSVRVLDIGLVERRLAGMRQDLVDAPTCHHITGEEQLEMLSLFHR